MRIAIHQPNFLPWKPYFQKIASVDKFVFLTECQFEKNGFQNRFNIGECWYTMSVRSGIDLISRKNYINPDGDWNFIKVQLRKYDSIFKIFNQFICPSLCITNTQIIIHICKILGIKTELHFDYSTGLKSTERLVDICKHHGATAYLAGASGANYMQFEKFKEAGINVEFQEGQIKKPILEILHEII